jgi:hypothetical protein
MNAKENGNDNQIAFWMLSTGDTACNVPRDFD